MGTDKEPKPENAPEKTEADKFKELTEKLVQVPKEEVEELKRKERERKQSEDRS